MYKGAHLKQRFRVQFETDAEREYFKRREDPGQFELFFVNDGELEPVLEYTGPFIFNGIANINVSLPDDCIVGDEVRYVATVTDRTLSEFTNEFVARVKPEQQQRSKKAENPHERSRRATRRVRIEAFRRECHFRSQFRCMRRTAVITTLTNSPPCGLHKRTQTAVNPSTCTSSTWTMSCPS